MRETQAIHRDKRGAVMLVAVFMCVFLVGALWYVVGLGDAMIYRQRMQDGADAIAYSSAVVHARGMNIIAMMNIIMAAVMAVLVALKIAQLLLAIVAAVAAVILAASLGTCGPCAAVIAACAEGIAQIQQVIDKVKQPIFNTLKALSTAQKGVAVVTPWLSQGEAVYLAHHYGKPIKLGLVASPSMIPRNDGKMKSYGLPVEDGDYAKLCGKAGENIAEFIFLPLEILLGSGKTGAISSMASAAGSALGGLTQSVSSFFCEGGSTGGGAGGDIANTQRDKLVDTQCKDQKAKYEASQNGGPKSGFDPKFVVLGKFQPALCEESLKKDFDDQMKKNPTKNDSGVDGDVKSRTPKRVSEGSSDEVVKNGSTHFGVYSFVLGDTSGLHYAPKLVAIAGWGKRAVKDPGASVQVAFAGAEFYYDCAGTWGGRNCNANEEAMWSMRWKARLRSMRMPGGAVSDLMSSTIPQWMQGGGMGGGPGAPVNPGDVASLTSASEGAGTGQLQGLFAAWLADSVKAEGASPTGPSANPLLVQRLLGIPYVLSH